jgi:tight adherence protein B
VVALTAGEAKVLLAGLAGALAAVAVREFLRAAPAVRPWLVRALEPMRRAGTEGYSPTSAERRRLGLLIGAALLGLGAWSLGPAPAAPLAAAGPAAASWAISSRARRYRRAVERALPQIAVATADALAAGRSVRAALDASAASLEGPAATEMSRVSADLDLGVSLEVALRGLRERIGSPRIDAFTSAVLSQRIAGGDLVGLLRRYAEAAAAKDRAEADARSATAQARFTGILVAAMPAGGALLAELLHPGFVAGLLGNGVSFALLAAAGLLQLGGFAAIARLGRVEVAS